MSKIVLITGATSGFGAAMARVFVADGWRVIISGRRQDRLDALSAELSGAAPKSAAIYPLPLDVRDRTAVFQAIESLPEAWRPVHTLINNAGLALGLDPAHKADLDQWDTMVDTNIKGVMYITRAVLPTLIQAGSGTVINIGSVAGTYPYPGGNTYGGTKAFVHQFSLNLRNDLSGTGVRVTCIEPGLAETEFSLVRFGGNAEQAAAIYKGTDPLTADNIAETALWVAKAPANVNYNTIEMMATCQSWAPFHIYRT